MGINLWDIGAVATGAIERDREHTAENLKIRADELSAKRNALIQRKNKKYDAEIKSYYKEKGTMDKINSLNSEAAAFNEANKGKLNTAGDEITYDQKLYATRYLLATVDGFKDLDKTERDTMIKGFSKSGANYQMQTKDPDKLAALQSKEEDIILSNYASQLKNAKDDSFLINKILGKKTTVSSSADLEKAVDADVKASEIVTKIDNAENPDKTDGTSIQLTETIKAFSPSKDWRSAYKDAFGNTKYDMKNTQVISYLNTLGVHGGNDELSLKFNKTDSEIAGHNANSMANIGFMKHMFNQVKDSKTVGVVGAITGPDNFEQVGSVLNTDKVLSEMTSILDQNRSGNIKEDIKIGWGGDIRLTTFVPLNVADTKGNLIIKGIKVGNLNEAQMGTVNGLLNNFIVEQAKLNPRKDIDAEGKAVGVYRKLYKNQDAAMLNSFNEYMLDNNKDLKASYEKKLKEEDTEKKTTDETSTEVTTTEGVDTPPKFKISTTKDGSAAVEVDGEAFKIKDNLDYLKSIPDEDLQKAISEAIKFETDMEKAPIVGTPKKYLDQKGKRGVKKINPEWQKLQDMNKAIVASNVKPVIPKRKIR